MTCFVDTSALLAVMNQADAVHGDARKTWEMLTSGRATLVTTNYVLLETISILQHRVGVAAVRTFHDDIVPVLTIEWISSDRHDAAMTALLAADRRRFSLVDSVSIDTMRRRGLRYAFAFDKHFDEQGFATLMPTTRDTIR